MQVQQVGMPTKPPHPKIREPLPVAPFLAFCAKREAQIARDLDAYPAIGRGEGRTQALGVDPKTRLAWVLGWDPEVGLRKLNRWSKPNLGEGHSGWVARADIEDAIHAAGGAFEQIYPDAAPAPPYVSHLGAGRYMTDEQIVAAHTVYVRAKLTTREVAQLVYRRFGYVSVGSASRAIRGAWKAFGLPVRQCEAIAAAHGGRCRRHPSHGVDHCPAHVRHGWSIPRSLADRARELHEDGVSFNEIGVRLLPDTPWRNPHYLSAQLSRIAADEDWHRTRHLGCHAKTFQMMSEGQP